MNEQEEKIKIALEKKGLRVLRNGWPDFLVVDEDKHQVFTVEVKGGKDQLSNEQKDIHRYFAQMGVPAYIMRTEKDVDDPISSKKALYPIKQKPVPQKWLRADQLSEYCGLAKGTLGNMRNQRRGPSFFKIKGIILYKVEEVDRWIEDGRVLTMDSREIEEKFNR